MVRGEGEAVVRGVTPQQVFDFVLDPAQYTKADTKMVWVTKLADTSTGMIAREDGKFLGRLSGSVVTRYVWDAPTRIDVTLEHGAPKAMHAWFEIDAVDGGTRIRHVEELDMGRGCWAGSTTWSLAAGSRKASARKSARSPASSNPASAAAE